MRISDWSSDVCSSDLIARHKGGTPLVCLTAYTTPMAELVDPCCDIVLVGDSLGMVRHGLESTLGVTLEMMILHGKEARRGLARALKVGELPFGTYEESPQQAMRTSQRDMAETGFSTGTPGGGAAMAAPTRFPR